MTATAGRPQMTDGAVPSEQRVSQFQRLARHAYRVLAAVFVAGVASQFLIVGMALFVDGSNWDLHQMIGHALAIAPLLMLGFALGGRMSLAARLLSPLLVILVLMQQVTVSIGDWAGAFHPLNAAVMLAIGFLLLQRTTGNDADAPYR